MTEEEVRRIVREEVAAAMTKAAPIITSIVGQKVFDPRVARRTKL